MTYNEEDTPNDWVYKKNIKSTIITLIKIFPETVEKVNLSNNWFSLLGEEDLKDFLQATQDKERIAEVDLSDNNYLNFFSYSSKAMKIKKKTGKPCSFKEDFFHSYFSSGNDDYYRIRKDLHANECLKNQLKNYFPGGVIGFIKSYILPDRKIKIYSDDEFAKNINTPIFFCDEATTYMFNISLNKKMETKGKNFSVAICFKIKINFSTKELKSSQVFVMRQTKKVEAPGDFFPHNFMQELNSYIMDRINQIKVGEVIDIVSKYEAVKTYLKEKFNDISTQDHVIEAIYGLIKEQSQPQFQRLTHKRAISDDEKESLEENALRSNKLARFSR